MLTISTAANQLCTLRISLSRGLTGLTVATTATASSRSFRRGKDAGDFLIVVCNFTPQPHSHYRIGVPELGFYTELLNSDAREYGGSNMGNLGGKWADEWSCHNLPYSLDLCLPPLGVLILKLNSTEDGSKNGVIEF